MMNTKYFYTILLFFLVATPIIASEKLFSISFGPVKVGESRIPINFNDFKIIIAGDKNNINAEIIRSSLQWIRTTNNLLTPRIRLSINIKSQEDDIYLKYLGNNIIPTKNINGIKKTEIYVNLFAPGDTEIFRKDKKISSITINANHTDTTKKSILLDYSCSKYHIKIEGMDNDYLSAGCRLERIGKFRNEKPRVEFTFTSTNYRLLDGSSPPFIVYLHNNDPAQITLIKKNGQRKLVTISAKIPKRLKRLKTAYGLGPYSFHSKNNSDVKKDKISPAFMLYGKYDITNNTSIKAFDAIVANSSVFNNFGLYFSYELADALDGRLELIPLLGAQTLSFKYNKDTKTKHHVIFPQGFEAVFKHPFGQENYTFVYGMFLSTTSKFGYKNLWIRYGKGYFWELNYIDFKKDNQLSRMWGLSIGLPLGSFF